MKVANKYNNEGVVMDDQIIIEEEIVRNENRIDDEKYGDNGLFQINSWGADLSFRELINMYAEDELQKPELQRYYVWDKREASRFIESILLGLPVPSIFLARTQEENYLIIDGYQRIMTVVDFVNGVFTKDGSSFKLSPTVNELWANKTFSQLSSEEQKRLRRTTIHSIIFEQKRPTNDDTSMYQIFERINTGGRTLFPQEIRNCVYHNEINTLLFELNVNPAWRTLFGQSEKDSRMRDMEFILRFLMFSNKKFSETTAISLKKELNLFMDITKNKDGKYRCEDYKKQFLETMELLVNTDKDAFRNINEEGSILSRFHPTIFDSIAVATKMAIENGVDILWKNDREAFLKAKRNLLKDLQFIEYTTTRTTNTASINGRIDLAYKYLFEEVQ